MTFLDLPIIPPLQKALAKQGFSEATPIQEQVINHAIEGRDILGSAQTGSGKTLAFVLPTLQNLYNKNLEKQIPDGKVTRKIRSLILAPTRELVMQIGEVFAPYATNVNLKYTCIYGGVNDFHQIKAIEKGVDILIATPGRLEDLISQGVVKLSYVEILTIDEADRMLDLGFLPDVKKILKRIPQNKQTFFFSRTIPQAIKELANSILKTPEIITIKGNSKTVELANQEVYYVKTANKRQLLQQIIKRTDLKSIIVFVKTREDTDYVMSYVKSVNIKCDNIHKDKSQNARQNSIQALKTGKIKVLVGTDLASRGIDISDLSCVINYNIPSDPEDYIHRIGRTARAGKGGLAISMCAEDEKSNFEAIERLIGKKIKVITDDTYKSEIIQIGKKIKVITDDTYKSEIIQKSEFVQTIRKSSAKKTKKPKKNYSANPYLGKSFDPEKVGKGKKIESKNEKFSNKKIESKNKSQTKEKPQRKQYDNKKVVKADKRRKKGF